MTKTQNKTTFEEYIKKDTFNYRMAFELSKNIQDEKERYLQLLNLSHKIIYYNFNALRGFLKLIEDELKEKGIVEYFTDEKKVEHIEERSEIIENLNSIEKDDERAVFISLFFEAMKEEHFDICYMFFRNTNIVKVNRIELNKMLKYLVDNKLYVDALKLIKIALIYPINTYYRTI